MYGLVFYALILLRITEWRTKGEHKWKVQSRNGTTLRQDFFYTMTLFLRCGKRNETEKKEFGVCARIANVGLVMTLCISEQIRRAITQIPPLCLGWKAYERVAWDCFIEAILSNSLEGH